MSGLAVLTTMLTVLAGLLCVPAGMLLLQVVAARIAMRRDADVSSPTPSDASWRCDGPIAVVVPAHDEAQGIGATLASVRAQLRAGDRLLVVADNCRDQTANVARAAGAEVIERRDDTRRGKGYALDYAVRHLAASSARARPWIVLIIDADCLVRPGAIGALVKTCMQTRRPAQACYLMHATAPSPTLGERVAEFAFIVKNRVRPLGMSALGWPSPLFGSGMAFPFELIADAPLANGHLVEDMQLGVDLAAQGLGAVFVAQAHVSSAFPTNEQGQRTQRERWEHGHLHTIASQMPRLLLSGLVRGDRGAVALAFDLAIPPLALLVLLGGAVATMSLLAWALGASFWPLGLTLIALAMLGSAVALAWQAVARDLLPLAMLWRLPAYVLRKLPLYGNYARARQTSWLRSRRDHERD